jgi:hypothetical protein
LGWECTRFLVGAASGREGSRYKPLRGQRPLLQGGRANRSLKDKGDSLKGDRFI